MCQPQLHEALDNPATEPADKVALTAARWQAADGHPADASTRPASHGRRDRSVHPRLFDSSRNGIYVEAGFTPLEALQAATIVPARALGVESESGSLALGKRGDVFLLDADPLADIHNTRKVWRHGGGGRSLLACAALGERGVHSLTTDSDGQ